MPSMIDNIVSLDNFPYVFAGVAGIAVIIWGKSIYLSLFQGETKKADFPQNTVILHQMGRAPHAPSLSPFPLKLETYLRMANISYQTQDGYDMSSKGKTPWMSYNGVDVADSQFCVEYLNKERGIDLNKHLSEEQRGIAQAFRRMMEDGLYWCVVDQRWIRKGPAKEYLVKEIGLPRLFVWYIAKAARKYLYGQGTGRHSPEEIDHLMERDLKALSQYLGKKKFLFGDEPCEEDCAIFGFLVQIRYCLPGMIGERLLNDEFRNLEDYVERMKAEFWPDWNDCLEKKS